VSGRDDRWEWHLPLLGQPWVTRYSRLALLGTLLLVVGFLADVGWLLIVGSVFWAPFVLWFVTLFLVVVGVVLVGWLREPSDGRAFDAALWRDESRMADGVRQDMARRLLARNTLIGKTRAEVVEMLGEPSYCMRDGPWEWKDDPKGPNMVYQLGPGPSGFYSERLTVRIGPDGRVSSCHRWSD
jgi:hypothetical protein